MNRFSLAVIAGLTLCLPAAAHQGHDHIHASGTLNSVDEAKRMVNISQAPISQVGWPAMTLDYPVAASVDLKAVKPGAKIQFTLEKGEDGHFQVESLKPAEAN